MQGLRAGQVPTGLRQAFVLAYRHFIVWRRKFMTFLCLHILGPVVLLYGLGVAFGLDQNLPFVVPGIMVNTVAAAAFIGCTYGAMERFMALRYDSWLAATLHPWHLITGEAVFQAFKGILSGFGIWVAGVLLGLGLMPSALLASLPVLMLVGATAAMMGYCLVAISHSYDDLTLSEPFVTAAFVFSGVFVAISLFPTPLQVFAMLLPIYHGIEIIRPFYTDEALSWLKVLGHGAVLLGMLGGAGSLATALFRRRLMG